MQFVLRLLADKPNAAIPFNYPYLLTGWIYRVLADADQDYTRFLHERGYRPERHPGDRKTFRLFTFSDLRMHGYELRPREGCFVLTSPIVDWTLSFYVEHAAEAFIQGLFMDQHLTLMNRRFRADLTVERVGTVVLPVPSDVLTLRTLSPVVVAMKDNAGIDQYLHPADEAFGPLLLGNLIDKYRSVAAVNAPIPDWREMNYTSLTPAGKIKSRLVTIKEGSPAETKVRGWYGFDMALRGPAEVLEVGLLAGVGRYNAEGFGCVGVVKPRLISMESGSWSP